MQKEKDPKASPLDLAEGEGEKTEKKVKFEEEPNEDVTYANDELLAWIGKGPGKGGEGEGQKGIQRQVRWGTATTAEPTAIASASAGRRTQT